MARFKRDRPEARDKVIQFRATAMQAEFLKRLADGQGLKVADLIRKALDEYLERHKPEGE